MCVCVCVPGIQALEDVLRVIGFDLWSMSCVS
jgi:hypothetical protein